MHWFKIGGFLVVGQTREIRIEINPIVTGSLLNQFYGQEYV